MKEKVLLLEYLNNLGVSLNKARQQVLQLLGSNESGGHQGGSTANANTPTLDSLARDLNCHCP